MNSTDRTLLTALLLASTAVVACASQTGENADTSGSAETWNRPNNPAFVDNTFVLDVARLPVQGQSSVSPIPSDYWPTSKDSLNERWDGPDSLSPAEKVEKAFGKPGFADAISTYYGVESRSGSKACKTKSDCSDLKDGSICAKRRGAEAGYCIPTWFGICHGWAPYSFSEAAPQRPVERNGVTFYPGDIEGLMSLAYGQNLPVKFLSQRCNIDEPKSADDRFRDSECRDMNPGSFHVLATNMLGLRQAAFVLDVTTNSEVWNHPVYRFDVSNAKDGKLLEVTKAEATALVAKDASDYKWNPDARRFYHVEVGIAYVIESSASRTSNLANVEEYTTAAAYEYILEADQAGTILGGEWIGTSREKHPDFAWWPTGAPNSNVAGGMLSFAEIKALNDESAVNPESKPGVTVDEPDASAPGVPPASRAAVLYEGPMVGGDVIRAYGASGGTKIVFTAEATANVDMVVAIGRIPTFERFDCKADGPGNTETCEVTVPAEGGSYEVRIRNTAGGDVSLKLTAEVKP